MHRSPQSVLELLGCYRVSRCHQTQSSRPHQCMDSGEEAAGVLVTREAWMEVVVMAGVAKELATTEGCLAAAVVLQATGVWGKSPQCGDTTPMTKLDPSLVQYHRQPNRT